MDEPSRIILLSDAREMKKRQQAELKHLREHMEKLQSRYEWLVRDMKVTELAIKLIERETTANTLSIKT
jgi:hypothetical protein